MISITTTSPSSPIVRRFTGNNLPGIRVNEDPNKATLQSYDLLHFANELLSKTTALNIDSLNEVIEAINPSSNGKKLEATFKYGYDVFVAASHLRRTLLLSNPIGKTAVERDPQESDELFRVLKVYLTTSTTRVAA